MKGNLEQINEIPWAGLEFAAAEAAKDPSLLNGKTKTKTSVWGTGMTPEGIDQNPGVYSIFDTRSCWFIAPAAFHTFSLSVPCQSVL